VLHPFQILVSAKGDDYEVSVPFISARRFCGQSPSTLYDDVALYLMESVVHARQQTLPEYLFCPETTLRRVRVQVEFRDKTTWEGRVSVVLRRWLDEPFWEATVPHLGIERFAVLGLKDLDAVVVHWLRDLGGKDSTALRKRLDLAQTSMSDYLDLLEVDLDLPSILPVTVRAKRPPKPDESLRERARRRREVPPTTLREVGVNLVNRVLDGRAAAVVGRDALIDDVERRLQATGAAIVLVGPSGAGKSAILEAVIARWTAHESRLHARRDAWLVDANRIIAGMSVVGQWEARCSKLVDELSARGDVLLVDDLASLVWAGRTIHETTNVAEFIEPHVAQGEFRIVGECTPERLEAARELAPSFFAHFHVVQVPSLDEDASLRVLTQRIREIERVSMSRSEPSRLRFDPGVPEAVLAMTRRFSARRALPGRAVGLLEQLATEGQPTVQDDEGRSILSRNVLVDLVSVQSGLPKFILWEDELRSHTDIAEHFVRRIVGQPAATEAVASLVTVLQQGLNDPAKPIASMLFVGPTGVGKTETAKALAEYLFGHSRRMLRFDMSELQDPDSATRLFGDRYRPDGELTRRVRQQPFCVILFDEIEKAHPIVFDTLLALLDEGRLTSADGRTTDFCNTVILMTSNLGVREADARIGFGAPDTAERTAHFMSAVRAFFRPEFFNRIDRIVPFGSLPRDAMRPLVERILIDLMGRRGLARAGVLVEVEDGLIDVLIERGFDSRYGARGLRRAVEQQLVVPLARHLVAVPGQAAALVLLFRVGEGVGMEIVPLPDPVTTPSRDDMMVERRDLALRFAELRDWLDQDAASITRLRQLYSDLLVHFNADSLSQTRWTLFSMVSELLSDLEQVVAGLAAFEHESIAPDLFETRLDLEIRKSHKFPQWQDAPPIASLTDKPAFDVPERPTRREIDTVARFRSILATVLHRVHTVETPMSSCVVRLLPATREPRSHAFARDLWRAYRAAWSPWAETVELVRHHESWQSAERVLVIDPELEHGNGFALRLCGIAIDTIIEAELGFHLETRFSGPDVVAGLVRVERVSDDTDAITRLTALDREYAEFLEARRAGLPASNPRGALPVRRKFEQGVAIDPATGLRVARASLSIRECLARRLEQLQEER